MYGHHGSKAAENMISLGVDGRETERNRNESNERELTVDVVCSYFR